MRRDNPFEKVEEMLERMEQEFETDPFGMTTGSVAVDVRDRDDAFVVTADLPGFSKDDVTVTLADRTLRIEAERETSVDAQEGEYIRRERSHESASRSVRLPEAVAEEGIEASHENGVLTVTLPKQEAEGGTQIDIE